MESENETVEAVLRYMRHWTDERLKVCDKCREDSCDSEALKCPYNGDPDGCNAPDGEFPKSFLDELADRFESAWRREKAELCKCLNEAVDFHCGKCINKGGPCNKDCLFDRWNKALKSANAPVAEGGES